MACTPKPCVVSSLMISWAKTPACSNVDSDGPLASGVACTKQCETGYTPSADLTKCSYGTWSNGFTCLPNSCTAPSVSYSNAEGICNEGTTIAHGGKCTAQCKAGYNPNTAVQQCDRARCPIP